MPPTRSAAQKDADRMKHALVEFVGVAEATFNNSAIKTTFDQQEIIGFREDFLSLSTEDILKLGPDITVTQQRKLACLFAYFHSASRIAGGPIEILTTNKQMFDEYRTSLYDPTKPVIPWKTPIADPELDKWKRNVKPNGREYPMLKDEASFPRFKEKFDTTLEAHDLSHLIAPGRTPKNPEVEEVQQKWLYKVFQDIMVAPAAKAIVIKHLTDKNTVAIWAEITKHYSNSMTAELQSQKISTHCASVRFKSLNWRGGQQSFLLHFADQLRMCDVISSDNYSEGQRINFLHAAVSGVPNLETVLTLRNTAKKAAGVQQTDTFEEYLAALLDQAQVHDSANTASRGPRTHRQVNTHQLVFDDTDSEDIPQERETYSHNVDSDHILEYDQDTDIDVILCNSMDTRQPGRTNRRHARMNLPTWKSLTPEDQTAWDAVTDDGKTKILNYASTRGNRKDKGDTYSRSVESHDIQDTTPSIEVGTHITEDTPNILDMATRPHKATRIQSEAHIRELLAKTHQRHTKNVSFERSSFTPEAYSHERTSIQESYSSSLTDDDDLGHDSSSHDEEELQADVQLTRNNPVSPKHHVMHPPRIKTLLLMPTCKIWLLLSIKALPSNALRRTRSLVPHALDFARMQPSIPTLASNLCHPMILMIVHQPPHHPSWMNQPIHHPSWMTPTIANQPPRPPHWKTPIPPLASAVFN